MNKGNIYSWNVSKSGEIVSRFELACASLNKVKKIRASQRGLVFRSNDFIFSRVKSVKS